MQFMQLFDPYHFFYPIFLVAAALIYLTHLLTPQFPNPVIDVILMIYSLLPESDKINFLSSMCISSHGSDWSTDSGAIIYS